MPAPVVVELGGEARELRFDLNALAALKQRCGLNVLRPPEGFDPDGDPVVLRQLVWAGLLHADRTLSEEMVGGWVTLDQVLPVSEKVAEALMAALAPEVSPERAGP